MSLAVRIFRSDRSSLLLVVPVALLLFALNLGGRDLWNPDEPRTALLAANVLATGDWAVLRLDDAAYLEKPPLYVWLAAAASLPPGRVSEFSARLPANAAALLCVVCLFYLGRDLYGRRTGALAALVLATSQDFFMEARWAHPDMLLCVLLTTAGLAFYRARRSEGAPGWLAVFYLAVGLAVLTKGPAGLLPVAAAAVFLAATRDLGFVRRAGLGWGAPLALLPAGLWLAAWRAAEGRAFPVVDALGRLVDRMTEGIHHPRPLTHILTSLPLAFLPWALFLPGALLHTFPRRTPRDDRAIYLYSFLTVYLAVFAFSAEKRGVYLLPLLPLLALLVGRVWDIALLDWEPSPVARTLSWGLAAGVLLAGGASAYVLTREPLGAAGLLAPAFLLGGGTTLTALGALAVCILHGGGRALAVFSGGVVVCYLVIATTVLPALDPLKSARPFSRRVAEVVADAPFGIHPDLRPEYVFYSGRRMEVLRDLPSVESHLRSAPRAFCLMEEGRFEAARDGLPAQTRVLDRARVGRRVMLLVGVDGSASGSGARG